MHQKKKKKKPTSSSSCKFTNYQISRASSRCTSKSSFEECPRSPEQTQPGSPKPRILWLSLPLISLPQRLLLLAKHIWEKEIGRGCLTVSVGVFSNFFFFPCMEARRPWETEFWVWILTWLGPRLRFSSWLWTKLFNPQFLPLQNENPTIKLLGWYDLIPKRKSLHPAPPYPFLLSYPQLLVQFPVLSSSAVLLSIDIFTEGSMAMRMHLPEMSLIL